jgi:hypothetical protein
VRVALAAEKSSLLATTERFVQHELTSGLAGEAVDFRGVAAVPQSASVHGGQHFELNGAEWLV